MNRRAFLAGACVAACTRRADAGLRVLDGAGATLPYPLYAKWSMEYARIDPTVRINYQPLGSGAGIRQIADGVVDFGASDEPMSQAQLDRAPRPLVHVPTTIGAVVLAYNLAEAPELKVTPEIVADVFLGAITRWDDPRLRAVNPDVPLPSEPIVLVHRAEGSGTSATLTTLLGNRSATFRERVGAGTVPHFPVGVGARGNDGVAAFVQSTPRSFGYVEIAYARAARLSIARVMNRRGRYVPPTLEALERAAKSALAREPEGSRLSIVDADDDDAYPIAALSLVIVPREPRDRARGEALARFLWWAVHDGQRFAPSEGYAALPPELGARAEAALRSLRADGRPLVGGG